MKKYLILLLVVAIMLAASLACTSAVDDGGTNPQPAAGETTISTWIDALFNSNGDGVADPVKCGGIIC